MHKLNIVMQNLWLLINISENKKVYQRLQRCSFAERYFQLIEETIQEHRNTINQAIKTESIFLLIKTY